LTEGEPWYFTIVKFILSFVRQSAGGRSSQRCRR
jgi:hypothetical protein